MVSAIRASLAAGLLLAACSYGFRGNLPSHMQTVAVEPFGSTVTEYGLEQEMTDRVTTLLVRDGRLAVVPSGADSELEGTVAAYSRTPYSYTAGEVVEEYKLQMSVNVTFTDLVEEAPVLESESVTQWVVYDPDAETETDARARLLEETAEEVVRRCLSGW